MATYKVLQDIEAEDKLVGPLTLRQCIYAAIAIVSIYFSYLVISKGAAFLAVVFLPFIGFGIFFAFPWNKQQSTEVWALAKVRFALKPRKRIWDQSGIKQLVAITAPKQVEDPRKNSHMSEVEVRNRLAALAATVDSRGWAVKNVPGNLYAQQGGVRSDRLMEGSTTSGPQVIDYKSSSSDDMFDLEHNPLAQQFDAKISAATQAYRQQLVNQMNAPEQAQPAVSDQSYWYASQPMPAVSATFAQAPMAAMPTPEEEALAQDIKRRQEIMNEAAYGNISDRMKVVLPLSQQPVVQPVPLQAPVAAAPAPDTTSQLATQILTGQSAMPMPPITAPIQPAVPVTPVPNPAILELANNNDLDVATIARVAHESDPNQSNGSNEVVVSLH